jgi:hypothetical protein
LAWASGGAAGAGCGVARTRVASRMSPQKFGSERLRLELVNGASLAI